MNQVPRKQIEARQRRGGCISIALAVVALFIVFRITAGWTIDYQWWKEMGQLETWVAMLAYEVIPIAAVTVIAFVVFWIAHARGMMHGGTRMREHPIYARLATAGTLAAGFIVAVAASDTWAVVRFFGARGLESDAHAWHDPVFGKALAFYLFDLPFFSELLRIVLFIAFLAAIIYWVTGRAWKVVRQTADWSQFQFNVQDLRLGSAFESKFIRGIAALFLTALAARFYLDRYEMLTAHHPFMVGIDYVNQYISLPLQWALIASCLLAAAAVLAGRPRFAAIAVLVVIVRMVAPPIVAAVYVRPNEISLERPFIERHIAATRSAFGLDSKMTETQFNAQPEAKIDLARHKPLLDNVRLWDWRAFHETVSQIQPLRPYVYSDTDVDRYTIDGQLRQVLLSPRELDLKQLGDAGNRWINPHFIYTHGYGIVMAEANQITAAGLPVLFVKDAPPVITVPSLKLNRPEIYFGEVVHEPVFVRTAQPEFNYPSGSSNVHTRYDGKGGFPVSSLWTRTAAALAAGNWNVLLTSYLTPESRMMIHRKITERLHQLAGFLQWDSDPYLVLTADGRLVWIVDGYMTSDAHPYSASVDMGDFGRFNYIRNSVKATVDAYDGTVHMYVFDPEDPLVNAYRHLFPKLFEASSAMPADLRAHVRYPETIFQAQAEMYRLFHMRDPETFYNKSDLWDIPRFNSTQGGSSAQVTPSYVVATVPGSDRPEFLLMMPFSPHDKLNLSGVLMARCDGEHLGEKVVLLLSKQEIIQGPMQVAAKIDQDQNISKDLTLWNQQGSQVLRGQMLVLPIENTFLYVEPIYIQASQARMPQMKKVAVVMGNNLIYMDTWPQAVAALTGAELAQPAVGDVATEPRQAGPVTVTAPQQPGGEDPRIAEIRKHLQRYRDLVSQGKWSEAGKELEAVQGLVQR